MTRFHSAVSLVLLVTVLIGPSGFAQPRLRIYVEPSFNKGGGTVALGDALIRALRKERSCEVVNSAVEADLILSGAGETFLKGYLGRNHRVRYRNRDSRPIYGGHLSVELRDKNEETVWSDLVTPGRFGGGDIGTDLANQAVKGLAKFLAAAKGAVKP